MPLLSTLAALVILVHSAEEEMERHHLALRQADPGGPDYEFDQVTDILQTLTPFTNPKSIVGSQKNIAAHTLQCKIQNQHFPGGETELTM